MKKVLFVALSVLTTLSAVAQHRFNSEPARNPEILAEGLNGKPLPGTAAKTTAVGDTVYVSHINTSAGMDTITFYTFVHDTGAVYGTNVFGDKGFAERYDVIPATMTYKVIGVRALFGGRVTAGSSKTVTFNVWSQAAKSPAFRPTIFYNGLPGTSLASGVQSINNLGIAMTAPESDTPKNHIFATPTAYLSDSFFVGYTVNYTWATLAGDTIGLYSNLEHERDEPGYFAISTSDTTLNVVNALQKSSGTWVDNASEGYGLFNNMYIFPIVVIGPGISTGLQGIVRNNFTFRGSYPNPAADKTNIGFALAARADVTIDVTDIAGRSVAKIEKKGLAAGEHTVELNTTSYAAGEYIYLIRTSEGDGIASQLIIAR